MTAEVNNLILRGLRAAESDAVLIAWNWGQQPEFGFTHADCEEFVDRLDTDIALLCESEDSLPYWIGGEEQSLLDYSISLIGPSEKSLALWSRAAEQNREIFAKLQINNSWELASVPFLPVFPTFIKHFKRLSRAGLQN